ncbi:hypothetical protein [Rubellicoccus peritrichatus]|uniref:Uncharacterized protein n=1 Tax=Rubellicoccus peritrichatus TaxID=3080537 RepID=A0AAQ3LCU0_9BACT|nr:hypothetical protein [Puniceicoccus sp. CR14]WOO41203.1 hypothetical protein RZN69_21490 [Puniceicoccus sp. CR14]
MEIDREELLRQKALIEDQLRWIESKLAQTSESEKSSPVAESISNSPVPKTSPKPQSEEKEKLPIITETLARDSAPTSSTPETAATLGAEFTGQNDPGTVTPLQKFGCALIAIGVCVGILAALFLLPYLIYE